jgi:hypothetical protein
VLPEDFADGMSIAYMQDKLRKEAMGRSARVEPAREAVGTDCAGLARRGIDF